MPGGRMVHSCHIHDTFSPSNQWVPIALLSTLNPIFHGQSSAAVSTYAQRLAQHGGVSSTLQWVHLVLQFTIMREFSNAVTDWSIPQWCGPGITLWMDLHLRSVAYRWKLFYIWTKTRIMDVLQMGFMPCVFTSFWLRSAETTSGLENLTLL